MGGQKRNTQSKGKELLTKRTNQNEGNKTKVTKQSDIEFKIVVIKILKELTENYKEVSDNYISMKKEIETINKNQEDISNKIPEIKNTLEGITSRLDEAAD